MYGLAVSLCVSEPVRQALPRQRWLDLTFSVIDRLLDEESNPRMRSQALKSIGGDVLDDLRLESKTRGVFLDKMVSHLVA
jgi:hypothetical protein